MRLDKYICKSTELTRSEAIEQIEAGNVTINSEVAVDKAVQVHENNEVRFNGKILKPRDFRYILMHKPADTICSNIDEFYPSLFNHLDVDRLSELHSAGRLDADTTGLVLITDDGRWSFNITRPSQHCEKVYRVGLSRDIAEGVAAKFKAGVMLQGEQQLTLPAVLDVISPKEVLLTTSVRLSILDLKLLINSRFIRFWLAQGYAY